MEANEGAQGVKGQEAKVQGLRDMVAAAQRGRGLSLSFQGSLSEWGVEECLGAC